MKQIYKLPLVLEPQAEGGYTITCPLLPNLVTEADTLEQVPAHVADALDALLELYHDQHLPLPPAFRALTANPDSPLWIETLIQAEAA
jgi:antitoxin HicB